MTFELTNDWELVKTIVTHPAVYPAIRDDYSPAPEDWQPVATEICRYYLVWDNEELLGLWVFTAENSVCWDVHTCLLPCSYGERAKQAAKEMAKHIFETTPCVRIITHVPVFNRLALRFALNAGFEPWGKNVKSYMKDGILYDQILLGMSKPGVN